MLGTCSSSAIEIQDDEDSSAIASEDYDSSAQAPIKERNKSKAKSRAGKEVPLMVESDKAADEDDEEDIGEDEFVFTNPLEESGSPVL